MPLPPADRLVLSGVHAPIRPRGELAGAGRTDPLSRHDAGRRAGTQSHTQARVNAGRAVAFVLCLGSFAVLASVLRQHLGFPLDDSWIHQTVARNLVDYGVLGYLPGVHSSGSSSLLWTAVLAFQYRFLPLLNPVLFSTAVNGILLGLTGFLLKALTEQDGFSPQISWIFALAPAISGNFLWLGLLGMEHVLFVTLSVAAVYAWFAPTERSRTASATGASVLVGLLVLTRPEGLFLAALLLLYRHRAGRSLKASLGLLLGAAVAQGIAFGVNWQASHTLLPLTMKGRLWLYFGGTSIGSSVRLWFVRRWAFELLANWTSLAPATAARLHLMPGLLLLTILGAVAVAWTIRTLGSRGKDRMSALLLWMAALTLLYCAALPATGHGGRYQPLQMLLMGPLLWIGFSRCLLWGGMRLGAGVDLPRNVATAATFLLMGLSAAASWGHWRALAADGIDQIDDEHGAMGLWVEQHVPADEVRQRQIAVFDIGRIGYGLHGSLVDLGGLTDPHYLPFLTHGEVPVYLREHHVQIVILPTFPDTPNQLAATLLPHTAAAFEMQELHTVCFPLPRAEAVMDSTGAALPCQTAYSLHFPAGTPSGAPAQLAALP